MAATTTPSPVAQKTAVINHYLYHGYNRDTAGVLTQDVNGYPRWRIIILNGQVTRYLMGPGGWEQHGPRVKVHVEYNAIMARKRA